MFIFMFVFLCSSQNFNVLSNLCSLFLTSSFFSSFGVTQLWSSFYSSSVLFLRLISVYHPHNSPGPFIFLPSVFLICRLITPYSGHFISLLNQISLYAIHPQRKIQSSYLSTIKTEKFETYHQSLGSYLLLIKVSGLWCNMQYLQ